jgi:tetratricopeptide (TPR) repeat protein
MNQRAGAWDAALRQRLLPLLHRAQIAEQHGDWDRAAQAYQEAVAHVPADHRLCSNLGNVLWLADQPEAALGWFERASTLAPAEGLPWRGIGNALRDLQRFGPAARAYRRSADLQSDPLTGWNLSQTLIGLERYREAFTRAEERLAIEALEAWRAGPGWNGSQEELRRASAAGIPLQIWSEQGFGDTLQHLRWLQPLSLHLTAQDPVPQLLVEEALVPLLREGLRWMTRPPQMFAKPAAPPPQAGWEQHHIALQSLPARLDGGAWSHPLRCGPGPWLQLPRAQQRRTGDGSPLRVGVLWAAGRKLDDGFTRREYSKRSLPAAALGSLLEGLAAAGAGLVGLQHGNDRERAEAWRWLLVEELPATADFLATAQLLLTLDLVITVDTAMAHLAGCLGMPTWVLLPWSADPRWLRQRSDSPWYPSLRLFRQPRTGDWPGAIAALLQAFRAGEAAGISAPG